MAHKVQFTDVTFLGTSSGAPTKSRNVSAISVSLSDGGAILIDAGESTQKQFLKSHLRFKNVKVVLITHLHGDHVFGLVPLLCTSSLHGRTAPLTIVGPDGIKEFVESNLKLTDSYIHYGLDFVQLPDFQSPYFSGNFGMNDLEPGEIDTKVDSTEDIKGIQEQLEGVSKALGVTVTAYPLKHRVSVYGYKIQEHTNKQGRLLAMKAMQLGAKGEQLGMLKSGKDVLCGDVLIKSAKVTIPPIKGMSIAILQDTCNSSLALNAIQGVDLLIHECTYDKTMEDLAKRGMHSTSTTAGAVAAFVNAKMLGLTHFSARYTSHEDPENPSANTMMIHKKKTINVMGRPRSKLNAIYPALKAGTALSLSEEALRAYDELCIDEISVFSATDLFRLIRGKGKFILPTIQ